MFFLIPLGHSKLTVKDFPYLVAGIILICTILTGATFSAMQNDAEDVESAVENYLSYFNRYPYLSLTNEFLITLPANERMVYDIQREWVDWYFQSSNEVDEFLKSNERRMSKRTVASDVADFVDSAGQSKGGMLNGMMSFEDQVNISPKAKYDFLLMLSLTPVKRAENQQENLNERWEQLKHISANTLVNRFGFIPAHPTFTGIFTYMFLQVGLFHMLFNMIFLWLAGAKMEDTWGRHLFAALYILFGIVAVLTHTIVHPHSIIPVVGASGAIAGVMGAFFVRYAKAKIKFFYVLWLISLVPHKGTFEARAYVVLPMWFLIELVYGLYFDKGDVAYWTQVGGFMTGVIVALAFKYTDFEKRILNRELDDDDENVKDDVLIAFQESNIDATEKNPETIVPDIAGLNGAAVKDYSGFTTQLFVFNEILINHITDGEVGIKVKRVNDILIGPENIEFIAVGRIDRIDKNEAGKIFSLGLPNEPAYVITLVKRSKNPESATREVYLINAEKCQYPKFLPNEFLMQSSEKKFTLLTRLLLKTFKDTTYIHGPGPRTENNLPIYDSVDTMTRHIQKSIKKIG
ncbi:MAG: rhomboid family intramembrane serine protease [Deltaproteobacteria bacterium]|nr:rhomboid family intramembrane serine protease [Deltaproteobacteria bacterium]